MPANVYGSLFDPEFVKKNPALAAFQKKLEETDQVSRNILNEQARVREQMQGVMPMVQAVTEMVTQLREEFDMMVNAGALSPPPFYNYANNSDFSFEQEDYLTGSAYANDDQDAAEWYARTNTTSTQFTENTTGAQSSESLRNTTRTGTNGAITTGTPNFTGSGFTAGDVGAHIVVKNAGTPVLGVLQDLITTIAGFTSGTAVTLNNNAGNTVGPTATYYVIPRPSYWDKAQGLAVMGHNWGLAHPLVKNIASPGAVIYVRFQIRKNPNYGTVPIDYKIQASLWDNTSGQQKTIEGSVWNVTAVPAVAAPGVFQRKYILRVESSAGPFYSDVISPATVNNQVSVGAIDNVNFVNVQWPSFPEASRYILYRFDSEFNEWREIASINNGAVAFQDRGGRTGALFTPPVSNVNAKAQVRIANFASLLDTNTFVDFMFTIRVPSNYTMSSTTNKQWLRIDILDASDNYATINAGLLYIDKVGVGYNNGRWTMSAKDLNTAAQVTTTAPPPVDMPGGNDPLPTPGSGAKLPKNSQGLQGFNQA